MVTQKPSRWRSSWRLPVAFGFFLSLFEFVHAGNGIYVGVGRFFWAAAILGLASGVKAAWARDIPRADRVPGLIVIGLHLAILFGGAIELSRQMK